MVLAHRDWQGGARVLLIKGADDILLLDLGTGYVGAQFVKVH